MRSLGTAFSTPPAPCRTTISPSSSANRNARSTACACAASIIARRCAEPDIQRTETDFAAVNVRSTPAQCPSPRRERAACRSRIDAGAEVANDPASTTRRAERRFRRLSTKYRLHHGNNIRRDDSAATRAPSRWCSTAPPSRRRRACGGSPSRSGRLALVAMVAADLREIDVRPVLSRLADELRQSREMGVDRLKTFD